MSTAQAAARLRVDVRTVHRLVKAGKLAPAFKLGGLRGAYLFDAREVERVASKRAQLVAVDGAA